MEREKSGKCLYICTSFERTREQAGTFVRHREIWVIRTGAKVMARWKKHSRVRASVRKGPFVRNTVRSIRARRTDSLRNVNGAKSRRKISHIPHRLSFTDLNATRDENVYIFDSTNADNIYVSRHQTVSQMLLIPNKRIDFIASRNVAPQH